MTCIIGLIRNTEQEIHTFIGGDSIGSGSNYLSHRKDGKVFKRKAGDHNYLFGFTSSYRMGQLIRYKLKIPSYKSGDIFKYMVNNFVESLRKCLKDHGYSRVNSNEESGGTFIVGFRGRLFEIADDYQVAEVVNNYNAVGSGFQYALGSLFSTQSVCDEEALKFKKNTSKYPQLFSEYKRIEIALNAASYFTPTVGGPYDIQHIVYKEK